jgi:hypothetical protein
MTPDFKGTKLFDRLCWAKDHLEPFQTQYAVAYEDVDMDCVAIMHPDPNAMAALMAGGIFPPVWVYWELAKDEAQPDFKKHTRGHLLHDTEPMPALSEEQAVEYLVQKDLPQRIWRNWNKGNKPKMIICKREQLPAAREWRNAWRLAA